MANVIEIYKNLIGLLLPTTGGTSDIFTLLGTGFVLVSAGWVFYHFVLFLARGFKDKK